MLTDVSAPRFPPLLALVSLTLITYKKKTKNRVIEGNAPTSVMFFSFFLKLLISHLGNFRHVIG